MRIAAGQGSASWQRLALATLLSACIPLGGATAQRGSSVYGAGASIQEDVGSEAGGFSGFLKDLEQAGWLLRGSLTAVVQANPGFRSRYAGPNSFRSRPGVADTEALNIVLGRRLWDGAELIVIPTLVRGYGLSNTLGIAQYPNGLAASRDNVWDGYVSHAFLRQTIDLSYDAFGQDSDPSRFAGPLAAERITLTAGRVSVLDFFDTNRYAVDANSQFLNWGLFTSAAFPTAADPRGGTNGIVVEWENPRWATRLGAFQVSRDSAARSLDPQVSKHQQVVVEVDRFWWSGRYPGALRLIAGLTRFRSRRWEALTHALRGGLSEPEGRSSWQAMVAVNAEQALTHSVGVFARAAWNDTRAQNWMFTEADWSTSAGVAITGYAWNRPDDTLGIALGAAGLSAWHRRYLAAGGTGSLLGDGQLHYATEKVLETYYAASIAPGADISLDYQFVSSPGFNAARGPVSVVSARLRLAF